MTSTVVDRDRGMNRLLSALVALERPSRVTIGVHADVGAEAHRGPSNATVAEVATITEFGRNPGTGSTSWLRTTIDEQRPRIEKALADAASRALRVAIDGAAGAGEIDRALGRVGAQIAREVQARVRRLGLVNSGQLLGAIEARVNGATAEASE